MKLHTNRRPPEGKLPRFRSVDVVQPQAAEEVKFDVKTAFTPKDRRRVASDIVNASNPQARRSRAFDYVLLFPEEKEEAKKCFYQPFPLDEMEQFAHKQSPLELLLLYPERRSELLSLLGTPEEIIQKAIKKRHSSLLIIAYLFLPEHKHHLEQLREMWSEVIGKGQRRDSGSLNHLAWLKIVDPGMYETMPATQEELERLLVDFKTTLIEEEEELGNAAQMLSVSYAFTLHVLTGGDATFSGDRVVVQPKTRLGKASPLPDRPHM